MRAKKNILGAAVFSLSILLSGLFLNSRSALAQSPPNKNADHNVDSDSAFYLTDSFLKTKAKNVLGGLLSHFELKSANQNIGTSPTVQLNQIDVTVTPDAYEISDDGNGLEFMAKGNVLKVSIGEVGIHETIQRNEGGVIAYIRVDVSCTGASVTITDPSSVISSQLAPGVNGDMLQINFINPEVKLVKPVMKLSQFQCTGATGFETLISSTLQSALNDIAGTNALLAQTIANNTVLLDNEFAFNWSQPRLIFGKADDTANPQGWVLPAEIAPMPNGDWQTTGTMRVILPTLVDPKTPHEKFAKWPLNISTEAGYVAIPDAAFVDMVKTYFAPGQWQYQDMANNYKAFADLLASGFDEFFLWSDLRKYPKTQPFPITVTTLTVPKVSWLSAQSFSLSTTFRVHMMTNGKPYVDFEIPTEAVMNFSVVNGQLVMVAQNPKFKISYAWDPSYCAKNCSSISTTIISKAMQAFLNNKKFNFDLPPLAIAGQTVNAESLTRDASTQTVILQLNPN